MHRVRTERKDRTASLTVKRLSAEIRRYCATHPNARDSLEGIAWWLAMQHYRETKHGLEDVVERLVKRGVLHKHELHDGSSVFGCSDGACASNDRSEQRRRAQRGPPTARARK
jgi:hypothetical protein